MGEYIKYKNKVIKLGTCESLYYASYPKYVQALESGQLKQEPGNLPPEKYAEADMGFLFRFPFPDEDHLKLGEVEDYRRGVPIIVNDINMLKNAPSQTEVSHTRHIELTQQKLIHRQSDDRLCLVLVYRDPYLGSSFRVENDADVKQMLKQLIRNNIVMETDSLKKVFYRQIARRIIDGYQLKKHSLRIIHSQKDVPKPRISTSRKKLN
ncbi:hypothetical protein [Pedobacter sp. V48]|uniref:hypothetical protein n=1 Tax=Pedobacter sp. V48 TaxID=509635 RepID=UPI0003E5A164|nr:hypothetical protein [Pedobacter sp. V48]ETZ23137.1 hypothetical protein N824_16895 [Pedobacter sp. V48]